MLFSLHIPSFGGLIGTIKSFCYHVLQAGDVKQTFRTTNLIDECCPFYVIRSHDVCWEKSLYSDSAYICVLYYMTHFQCTLTTVLGAPRDWLHNSRRVAVLSVAKTGNGAMMTVAKEASEQQSRPWQQLAWWRSLGMLESLALIAWVPLANMISTLLLVRMALYAQLALPFWPHWCHLSILHVLKIMSSLHWLRVLMWLLASVLHGLGR